MKTFMFIESANLSVKNFAGSLRSGNKEYTSLSRVLKDIQRSELLKAGYADAFRALGYEVSSEKLTPSEFMAAMHKDQFTTAVVGKGKEKHEVPVLGIWGWRQVVDENGNKVFEEDGKTPVVEAVLRKVSAWTPNKLFKCLAQAQAIVAENA